MELQHVIIGPVSTEKAERLKPKAYTLQVADKATKIDVKNALKKYWDVDVDQVRVMKVRSKTRQFGRGSTMEKRHPYKKAIVTLTSDSKPLDIGSIQTSA